MERGKNSHIFKITSKIMAQTHIFKNLTFNNEFS